MFAATGGGKFFFPPVLRETCILLFRSEKLQVFLFPVLVWKACYFGLLFGWLGDSLFYLSMDSTT